MRKVQTERNCLGWKSAKMERERTMRKIAKPVKWGVLIAALLVIGTTLFTEQPLTKQRQQLTHVDTSYGDWDKDEIEEDQGAAEANHDYWADCVNLAHQQATRPQTPIPSFLDDCYQSLLAKFSSQLLNDITSLLFTPQFTANQATKLVITLKKMSGSNQQPSVARLTVQMGYKGDAHTWERQELMRIDQSKVDPKVVEGYNAAIDKPLLDQLVKEQPSTVSNQKLDAWFTYAIMTTQPETPTMNSINWPQYILPPRVVPANTTENMTYHGGAVLDGIVNIYLIYWIDATYQPASPKYVSLTSQFLNSVGHSPLYANLMQYTDSHGRYPTSARLADTFTDTQPFPQQLVAARKAPNFGDSSNIAFITPFLKQEIQKVAALRHWNIQDYHNLFFILPTMNWGCGWHSYLYDKIQHRFGSTYAVATYPLDTKGLHFCYAMQQTPNNDPAADNVIHTLEHELTEAVSDPYWHSWYAKEYLTGEIADICSGPSSGVFFDPKYFGINPKTKANMILNRHAYIVQPQYSNHRHGCVLQGP